jgi:hypothetical protein
MVFLRILWKQSGKSLIRQYNQSSNKWILPTNKPNSLLMLFGNVSIISLLGTGDIVSTENS